MSVFSALLTADSEVLLTGITTSWLCFKPYFPTGGQAGAAEPLKKLSLSVFKLCSNFLKETRYRNISPFLLSANQNAFLNYKSKTEPLQEFQKDQV